MPDPGPHPPAALGRGVVVLPGAPAPEGWAECPRVAVDGAKVANPGPVVATLHAAWLARRAVVVELAVDPAALREPERWDGPVHGLGPDFELGRERLQFLVWANNYDARGAEPVWWHGRRTARRLADDGVLEAGPADVVATDGTPLYVDGGPPDPPDLPTTTGVVHRWSAEAGVLARPGNDAPAAELAADQLAAVGHGTGAARVLAPAGSGKTRVLTERLRHLVADGRAHPSTITAVAFNTRAADELRQRCGDLLSRGGPHVRTLNSLGLWICNELGGEGRLRVLDEPGARRLVEEVFPVRRQANVDSVAPYLDALSMVRLGLTAPEQAAAAVPDAHGLAEGFDTYRRALADQRAVDFDEQIYRAIETLVTDPVARGAAQATCRRMLVDELQDLTPAHLLLVRLLAAPGYDCFGVGDDDQVIYGYSGATPEFLIDFARYFPGAATYALEVNYRCPPAVVDAARHLLSYNRRRVDKAISPRPGRLDGPPVEVITAPAELLPHRAVGVVVAWRDAGVRAADIAVLARVNAALLPVQVAMAEAGVPATAPLGTQVLRRTGIRTALAYLRMALQPDLIARTDVGDTVHRPSRKISRNVVEMLTKRASTSVADIRHLAGRLSGGDVEKLRGYAADIEAVAAATRESSAAALRAVRDSVGLGSSMDQLDGSRREADRSTHADDLTALEAVAALHPDAATFEPWLREVLGRAAPDGPAVLLSTVHKIKGKEWPHVVVFGANGGLFPHPLSDDDEGERRIFHVALTRARTEVAVLADAGDPSPFVDELDGSRPHRPVRPHPPTRPTRPSRPEPGEAVPDPAAEAALRAWRSETARRDKVPAYVVLNDKELAGIAARLPGTMGALANCRGMGPIRLERYGDEILAALASSG
ncbi:MAG: ATP-dependent helicase [Acidimicrobiales bacterium]